MVMLDGYSSSTPGAVGIQPVPAGEYVAMITDSERKPSSKNKANEGLILTFTINEGQYKGRNVKLWLNMWHTDASTRGNSHAEFSAIKNAVGVPTLKDTVAIHKIPLIISVGLEPDGRDEQAAKAAGRPQKMQNRINDYRKRESGLTQRPAGAPPFMKAGQSPAGAQQAVGATAPRPATTPSQTTQAVTQRTAAPAAAAPAATVQPRRAAVGAPAPGQPVRPTNQNPVRPAAKPQIEPPLVVTSAPVEAAPAAEFYPPEPQADPVSEAQAALSETPPGDAVGDEGYVSGAE